MSELTTLLQDVQRRFETAAENVAGETELEDLRVAYLGRSGEVTKVRRTIGALPPQERPAAGKTINDAVAVESLPGMWNARYREYLGIEPGTDSEGILQDVHWSSGFGYFPSYTLGNLYAAQIFHRLREVFPDFDTRLESGETAFILRWLEENMYAHGVIYLPEDLMKRVTGETPNPAHFVRYLKEKFFQAR